MYYILLCFSTSWNFVSEADSSRILKEFQKNFQASWFLYWDFLKRYFSIFILMQNEYFVKIYKACLTKFQKYFNPVWNVTDCKGSVCDIRIKHNKIFFSFKMGPAVLFLLFLIVLFKFFYDYYKGCLVFLWIIPIKLDIKHPEWGLLLRPD